VLGYELVPMQNNDAKQKGLAEMEELLRKTEVGRLILSDGDKPYGVPINFSYVDRKIIFHCAMKGKKLDIIAKNPNCCLEVDQFMGEVSYHYDALCHLDYDSVLAFGKARFETDDGKKLQFFKGLHEKYKEIYRKPVSEGGLQFTRAYPTYNAVRCVVIDVEELTGRRERTVDGRRNKIKWHIKF
jgi:nitroimidazol reductase NimA-like FMN-containing flavoprotein (pyridoxamine 5'-phosphate oxidase superfamily)